MADKERTARVGRPRLPGSAKYIRLRQSVFNLWRERKDSVGKFTDSEFAEYLLHRRANRDPSPSGDELPSYDLGSIAPLSSTPVRAMPYRQRLLDSASLSDSNVDITGVTSIGEGACIPMQSVQLRRANISFGTVGGNPFSVLEQDTDGGDDDDDDDAASVDSDYSTSSTDSFGLFSGDQHFTNRMHSVIDQLRCSDTDSEDSDNLDTGDDNDDYFDLSVNGAMQSNEFELDNDDDTKLVCEDMEISVEDDERTITMVEDVVSLSQLSLPTSQPLLTEEEAVIMDDVQAPRDCGYSTESAPNDEPSRKVIDNSGKLLLDLENSLAKLTNIGSELKEFAVLHERSRFIVSAEKLLELAGCNCTVETDGHVCNGPLTHETKTAGGNLELFTKCANGHSKKWVSSEVLAQKRNQSIYVNDSLLPAAIIISGNNYEKFSLLCKALGLSVVGRNTFMRFQKHCAAPVVEEVWMEMNEIVKKLFKDYEDVCLCGDGRNDSPGHSARYCVYTLMEQFTNIVVDFEVIDKRETGGNSTGMEKEALRRLLERMATIFPFDELTTDASPTIIKLVRDLKEKFPQLMELFHSLDIWHKAKKLNKALHQAAKIKGCGELQEWIDCIVNHFWFCSQDCSGSVEELKETWCGVLHHVCGEHTWATGQCKHDPINDMESNKKYLEKGSKAMAALRKIVLDPKWLNTLHFYVRFRHTSVLESYNSMMTKYVPKRMAFEYPYFIMRVTLAAIDHNMHLSRRPKLSKAGKEQGHRKYSKRSQKFHAEIVKEEKSFSYFPFLVAKMLHRRSMYEGSFTLPSDRVNEFDPKQIAPTIGMKEPPPTEELMKGPSRFEKKEK